jgi:hypothetical protein
MLPLQSLGFDVYYKDTKSLADGEHPDGDAERVAATHFNRFLHGSFAGLGDLGEMAASGQESHEDSRRTAHPSML